MNSYASPHKPGSAMTRVWRWLLKPKALRRRIAFQIQNEHFAELGIRIPIGDNLFATVEHASQFLSFGEMFAQQEYAAMLDHMPLPRRWIDLGAHAGYFTLWLAARISSSSDPSWEALLIEPDPRMTSVLKTNLAQPAMHDRARLRVGAIGKPTDTTSTSMPFHLRPGMVSSHDQSVGTGHSTQVEVISADALTAELPGPLDLIKLDVEGAEYIFAEHYEPLYRNATAIVSEWHAPSVDHRCINDFRSKLRAAGFKRNIPLGQKYCQSQKKGPKSLF